MANEVFSMEQIRATANSLGIDITAVDFDSIIRLPPDDDIATFSDDDDLTREEGLIKFDESFGNIIVVDNLPVVPKKKVEKVEKLKRVVKKLYGQFGVIKEDGFCMPVDPDTQTTLGYCFIEFSTAQEAELAKEKTHGYQWGNYILAVNMFDDFKKSMEVPDEWAPPQPNPYTPWDNVLHWLIDKKARDQFIIRAGMDTEVYWNDGRQLKPDLVYKRPFWTESFIQCSPLGTYLATIHKQGVQVWGGALTFDLLMHYAHPQVKFIDFSPGERFLVTYSSHEPDNSPDSHMVTINIFDVRTGKLMRDFKGNTDDFAVEGTGGATGVSWPIFRWGCGRKDKYFARLRNNAISVYETETFTLIDKKSIKVENVVDFSWSPAEPILALFVPELGAGSQPARVSLIKIPSKEVLRQKNLFGVSDCKMYWQSKGEYLAVKVDRYTKTKKSTYTGFELFRIKERDIPNEVLEFENKNDKVIAFAWEPKGHRFAVIHGDKTRSDISLYSMQSTTNTGWVSKLTTLKGKYANALYWSPTGRFIVLASLKGFDGKLEFYDVDELETMATIEHFMTTYVEWDPSGRYVATAVTSVHEMENGFSIWSFDGKLMYQIPKDHLFQFLWRPRPPSLLTPEKEEEIANNLQKYIKKYEAEDQDVSLQLSEQECEKRRALKEEWERWLDKWRCTLQEEKLNRQKLQDGEASDEEEEYEAKEVEVEEVVDVKEEVILAD